MASVSPAAPAGPRIAAALLALILLVALALLFVILYVAISPRADALLAMGVVALVLALVSYLAQSLSRDPSVQRAVAWGLGAMGLAMLLLTTWFVPPPGTSLLDQLVGTLVVVLVIAVTVALAFWRVRSVARVEQRLDDRAAWDARSAPSAFDYAAAQTPGTGPVGAPPPPPSQRSP